MVRLLDEITPGRVLALLEGGYFARNYTEAAAMMVKGLKDEPVPLIDFPVRLTASLAETVWCNVIHHSRRYKCMQQKLTKLMEQQKLLGLEEFVIPEKIDLGKAVRVMWDEVKENRAVRTREWFPELSKEQVELATNKINEYVKKQVPASRAESYIQKAQACFWFHQDYIDFRDGKKDSMMICDHALYNFIEKKKIN